MNKEAAGFQEPSAVCVNSRSPHPDLQLTSSINMVAHVTNTVTIIPEKIIKILLPKELQS